MYRLLYATGNHVKFRQAQKTCQRYDVHLQQDSLDVPEIQGEDAVLIAQDKADKGFAKLRQPLVISDDSWSIPGLNGFPGAYMKSVNHWFEVDDWLHLTLPLADRRIILRQIVVFQDTAIQQIFSRDIEGILVTEPRGKSPFPHSYITSFDGGKHTTAEFHERNESAVAGHRNVWDDFAEWYSRSHEQLKPES